MNEMIALILLIFAFHLVEYLKQKFSKGDQNEAK
jgi:hypothetical protein